MCLQGGCTNIKSSHIKSEQGGDVGVTNWKKCQVVSSIDRNSHAENIGKNRKRLYPTANNTVIRNNFDILGGHFRIGTGDYILKNNTDNIDPLRHIIFLRDPIDRYISGVLYQFKQSKQKKQSRTLQHFVDLIKERVLSGRAAGDFWDRSLAYLLTPGQAEKFNQAKTSFMKANRTEQLTEVKAKTAIDNLFKYNAIVGMTEHMDQSMDILKYVLLTGAKAKHIALLEKYTNKTRNVSKNGDISTSSVLEELKKDAKFMSVFEEYVKYEKLINDYAMGMHLKQHEMLLEQRTDL
jgi:hypothetical protein